MNTTSKAKLGRVAGIAGALAILAACIPCCISLVAPMLAWMGATLGISLTGAYWTGIAVFALGFSMIIYSRLRRRACQSKQGNAGCGCGGNCSASR